MTSRLLSCICITAWALSSVPALAQQAPPPEPILRIDPGMHIATDRAHRRRRCLHAAGNGVGRQDRAAVAAARGQAAAHAASTNRTGERRQGVLRSPVAPDGSWVAAAGWDVASVGRGHFVHVFQSATGALAARLGPHGNVIHHLAVSSDGRYLAATLGNGQGLRVWERTGANLASWRLVAEDRDYGGESSSARPSTGRECSTRWPMMASCGAMRRAMRPSQPGLRPEGASGLLRRGASLREIV